MLYKLTSMEQLGTFFTIHVKLWPRTFSEKDVNKHIFVRQCKANPSILAVWCNFHMNKTSLSARFHSHSKLKRFPWYVRSVETFMTKNVNFAVTSHASWRSEPFKNDILRNKRASIKVLACDRHKPLIFENNRVLTEFLLKSMKALFHFPNRL